MCERFLMCLEDQGMEGAEDVICYEGPHRSWRKLRENRGAGMTCSECGEQDLDEDDMSKCPACGEDFCTECQQDGHECVSPEAQAQAATQELEKLRGDV